MERRVIRDIDQIAFFSALSPIPSAVLLEKAQLFPKKLK
jgi:hypothetical protein